MLADFRVTNYKSFKDEQVLSLIASTEESKGLNSTKIGNHSILKTAVIYGANASGKSNLIKAMACMNKIVCDSAGYKPSDKIPVAPFLFDEITKNQPTVFEATFFIDFIRYQYGFSATKDKIHNEWLLAWPKGKPQTWFKRDINESEPYFGPSLKGQNKSTWDKVKENSLFLSVAAQWNHKHLSKVYEWFDDKFRELPDQKIATFVTDDLLFEATTSEAAGDVHEAAIKMLRQADFGIDDFEIERVKVDNIPFPENMPDEIKKEIHKQLTEHPRCRKKVFHSGRKYSLNLEDESDGTQRFYSFLGPLLESAAFGYTIFKDELELNLHPLLTREIISSIRDSAHANCSAQLIFTTHDTTLLDPELFGRDQVWFTEKDTQGATQLYSLADYKETVRKDEAMQKRYLAGRYGAVPVLERFDLIGTKKQ
jgi:AAA15 family ATPase/GTPase